MMYSLSNRIFLNILLRIMTKKLKKGISIVFFSFDIDNSIIVSYIFVEELLFYTVWLK